MIGLNFDYVYLNIVGHSVYGAFNVGLFWVKTIQVGTTSVNVSTGNRFGISPMTFDNYLPGCTVTIILVDVTLW